MIYSFDDLSFKILTVGRFFHKSGFYDVKPRQLSAISFRVSGNAQFEVGGKCFTSSEGDILFLPANVSYKVEYSIGESIVVHLADCNYDSTENFSLKNPKKIELLFRELLAEWNERPSVNRCKSGVYGILDSLSEDQRISIPNPAFAKCVEFLEERAFDTDLKIDDVCAAGFMSASSMYRAFYASFGMSPKAYLNKLRMSRALSLLAKSSLSILEISEECGFSDVKYFSKAFKKAYGSPPSHFKSNISL